MLAVEAREIDRPGVGAQGAFAAQVVVVLEVTEGQLARGAVDGRAEAEAGKVGFGDASPEAVLAIDGDDMVVVVHGLEIHEQGRMAVDAQGGGGQQRAFKAVAFALAQHALRRPGGVGILVLERVNELLDAGGRFEGAEDAQVCRRKAEGSRGCAVAIPFWAGPAPLKAMLWLPLQNCGDYTGASGHSLSDRRFLRERSGGEVLARTASALP